MRERDPITLGPIRKRFLLHRPPALVAYDAHSLLAYVSATGDVCDPIARVPYATHELRRLARVCEAPFRTTAQLQRIHEREVARRELVGFLADELLAEAEEIAGEAGDEIAGDDDGEVVALAQGWFNLRAIATPDELDGLRRSLLARGVDIVATLAGEPGPSSRLSVIVVPD